MWSTTPGRLSRFVRTILDGGIPPTTPVRELQRAFRDHGFYPARDAHGLCTPDPPDAFFTYHSAQSLGEVHDIVWQASSHAATVLQRSRPELAEVDLGPMIEEGICIWIDFAFIDQSARDMREELIILPRLLQEASVHFVLGTQPLMRSWCCYEIALFNQRFAEADGPPAGPFNGPGLRSFIAPTRSFYIGWERTETSEAEDKVFISESIASGFPGGFDGFEKIMAQANTVAVGSLAGPADWSTPAADDNLLQAAESWYARTLGHQR